MRHDIIYQRIANSTEQTNHILKETENNDIRKNPYSRQKI